MKSLKIKLALLGLFIIGFSGIAVASIMGPIKSFFQIDNSSAPSVVSTTNILVPFKTVANEQDLQNALTKIKADFKAPVYYPTMLPKPANGNPKYFVGYMVRDKEFYALTFDLSQDCNGAKYCTAIQIYGDAAKKKQRGLIQRDHSNKIITEVITLNFGIKAYYTHGHAMGDYFPPMIVWDKNSVRYEIDWDGRWAGDDSSIFAGKKAEIEKRGLIEMANSIVEK